MSARLNTLELRQLKQRVALRHHLRALSVKECQDYITNRLRKAGGSPAIFTAAATEAIYQYSGGIPRLVNILCDNALLTGYAVGKHEVDVTIVREVADDLNLTSAVGFYARRALIPGFNGTTPVNGEVKQRVPLEPIAHQPLARPVVVNNFKSATPSKDFVSPTVLQIVVDALTDAMGPMARIVIREQMRSLNASADGFPREKLWSLIESASGEICDELMRNEFRQKLAIQIPNLQRD